jgi:hypothetical protein
MLTNRPSLQNLSMFTPQSYVDHIEKVFEQYNCKVVDFYAIPDYTELLKDCLDSNFGRYCKKEYTQHQFTFEAVEPNDYFPFGCKTTYRAYTQDAVVEIREEVNEDYPGINMVPYQAKPIRTYPSPVVNSDGEIIDPGGNKVSSVGPNFYSQLFLPGMHIVQKLSKRKKNEVKAQEFPLNSREMFDETLRQIRSQYQIVRQDIVTAWEEWDTSFIPSNDNVYDYINR